MKQIVRVGSLYLSRLEIDDYNDNININFDSDKRESKIFYDSNFLAIAINIINNTLKIEVEVEFLKEEERENE